MEEKEKEQFEEFVAGFSEALRNEKPDEPSEEASESYKNLYNLLRNKEKETCKPGYAFQFPLTKEEQEIIGEINLSWDDDDEECEDCEETDYQPQYAWNPTLIYETIDEECDVEEDNSDDNSEYIVELYPYQGEIFAITDGMSDVPLADFVNDEQVTKLYESIKSRING